MFFRLCTELPSSFDAKINTDHTQECIKRLLVFYRTCEDPEHPQRPEFEALYLLYNLGQYDRFFLITYVLQATHKMWWKVFAVLLTERGIQIAWFKYFCDIISISRCPCKKLESNILAYSDFACVACVLNYVLLCSAEH